MFRKIFIASLAILAISCGNSDEKNAERLLEEGNIALSEKRFDDARNIIDSLRTTYPNAIEARRKAISLEAHIELEAAKSGLSRIDSLLEQTNREVERLKKGFVLEKDEKYQATGYYVVKNQISSAKHRTALKAEVNEEGLMVLISVLKGQKLNHKSIKVETPSGESAQTPECFSFLHHSVAGYVEESSYKLGEDEGVIKFITESPGNITVTIQGSKEVKYQLSPSDKNAIKSCYELSTAMTKQRQLIQQAKDLNTKVKFYLKKISLDESQNAGAEE